MTTAIADEAPSAPVVTDYDKAHLRLYLRLLDADAERAAWEEVASRLLEIDPNVEPDRAKRRHDSHLARARWMTDRGYLDLLRKGP
ncbi:MAG: DNA -binding domain-containing protein [Caulobacteraceae bacterium]